MTDSHTQGGTPMRLPRAVRLTIFFAVVAAIVTGIVLGVRALTGGSRATLDAERVKAEVGETIIPFDNGYLATNGLRLRCFGANNNSNEKWTPYAPDSKEREVSASDKLIAMWRDESLHVLQASGDVRFNGSLESPVDLVRCGTANVAAYMPGLNVVRVLTMEGQLVEDIATGGNKVLNAGFFTDQDLLWILYLDKDAATPTTALRTYQPGKSETGGHTFEDQVVYDVMYLDNRLYAVGTSEVNIITIATADIAPKKPLVYGWQLIDRAEISKTDIGLLFTLSGESANGAPERLKLVRGDGSEKEIHLPPGCIAAFVGNKGVWGVAPDGIYSFPFKGASSEYALSFTIEEVVAKLSGNRLMVKVDGEMRMLTLP